MDIYIKNLLPRLKEYGQKLNKIESFVDKTWVLYNESIGFQTYRFKRGGRLIITTNGMIDECRWEYHPPDGLEIKPSGRQGTMYRHAFFLESLFIMQVEGNSEEKALFYNESAIPDGNVFNYLKNIYISKYNLISIGSQGKYYYKDPSYRGLIIGDQILDDNLEIIQFKKIRIGTREITIVNGRIQDIFYLYQLDSESGLLNIKSKTDENNLTVGAEVRYPNNNLANGVIKIHKDPSVKRIHVNNGIIKKVVEHHDTFFIAFLSVFILMIVVIVCAILFNQPKTDIEAPKNNPIDTSLVRSDQEKIADSSAIPTVFSDTTYAAPCDEEAPPPIETTVSTENSSQITNGDYSLFGITELQANQLELDVYLQIIFSQLHYINNVNPNEINKYIQAAKNINKKPILIYNLSYYVSYDDFLNEGNLCKRVSNIVKIDYIGNSYYVDLDFFP
jgi:hypothetical protein